VEKRRHERFLKKVRISYTLLSKVDSTPFEFGDAVTIDISRGGLSLLLKEPVPVPGLLQLHLRVPRALYGLFVLGKTVHCTPVEDIGMYRVGIKFVGLLPDDLEKALTDMEGT